MRSGAWSVLPPSCTSNLASVSHGEQCGEAVLAWDFFVAVTASFRMLSVFIVLVVGTSGAPHGS